MSTIVQMPVRVKPPPADTGDTISPGCASLVTATPLNGARMIVLSRSVCCIADLAFRDAHHLARGGDARRHRIDIGLRLIDFRLRHDTLLHQLRAAAERDARVGEPDLVFRDVAPRRLGLRLRERQRRPRIRIVQAREHLAFLDGHALLDVHLDDLAGDLRRDGGAPARRDVAGRVEHGRLRAGCARGDRRDLDLDRPLARRPHPAGAAQAGEDNQREDPHHDPRRARALGWTLDAQRRQIFLQVCHAVD